MKYCKKCSQEKLLTEFHKDSSTPDGKRAYCKECCRRYMNQRYHADIEKSRARERARKRGSDPEWREQAKRYSRLHRQRPEVKAKRAIHEQNRRARKSGGGASLTVTLEQLVEHQGNRCFWCSQPFTKARKATLDHHVPLSKGGQHSDSNVTATCISCNSSKKARTPSAFAQERGMLFAPIPGAMDAI